jgi:hypothetical protein
MQWQSTALQRGLHEQATFNKAICGGILSFLAWPVCNTKAIASNRKITHFSIEIIYRV